MHYNFINIAFGGNMGSHAFKLIEELEYDIVDFYKKVLKINHFKELSEIYYYI